MILMKFKAFLSTQFKKFVMLCISWIIVKHMKRQSKKEGSDQESIQSNTTPDPGHLM